MNESLPDDRFIPVRACDLLDEVATDEEIGFASMREVGDLCRHIVEQEAGALERTIEAIYAPSNPDRETILIGGARTDADTLHRCVRYLLDKANFEVLDEVGITDAIEAARARGVKVRLRPEMIESINLAVRGRSNRMRHVRDVRHPVKGTWQEYGIYRRLVVISRLKDDRAIYLKLFREIPIADLEALLPHAEIRMNWIDRAKVAGGGLGVVGATAMKISKVLVSLATLSKLLWIVGPALGVLMFKTFFGYRRTKAQRDSRRTQNLYYLTMATNMGVIHMLVSMIAHEEVKEVILAYAICRTHRPETREDLLEACNGWLRRRFGFSVQFDVDDAIETLERLDLLESGLHVRDEDEAIRRLRRHRAEHRSERYHLDACGIPASDASP